MILKEKYKKFFDKPKLSPTASFVIACNLNIQCRTFDYDSYSAACRLFEGSLNTGSLISSAPTSRIGSVVLFSQFYTNFGQPCPECIQNRYLACSNTTCQCPPNFFWNGVACENQRYAGLPCNDYNWCRADQLELVCSVANTCASKA